MTYHWLLFDADGTLFDYHKAEAFALQTTLEQSGVDFEPKYLEIYHHHNEQVWRDFERGAITSEALRTRRFQLMFAETGLPLDPEEVSPRYLVNLGLGSHLIDGTESVLAALHGRYKLALITNGISDVQRSRLERSTIQHYFEHIFISDEMSIAKPHPGYFDIVFETLGGPPKESVLIIGDSQTSDMQGGRNYGVDTCWVNPSGLPAEKPVTYEIRKLEELLELLK